MDKLAYIFSGGFLRGYRTYLMGAVIVVTALASYAAGDVDLPHTIEAIAAGLGFTTLRAAHKD
jgi:hypothetical protein